MADCLNRAVELGLEEICFTEHTDFGVKGREEQALNCPTPEYFAEFQRLQNIFQGKITMKFGMEFGMQVGTVAEFQDLFKIISAAKLNNSTMKATIMKFTKS